MKKIFVFALVLALLATAPSCSTAPKGGPTADGAVADGQVSESEASSETSDAAVSEEADATGGWGGDELAYRFSGEVNDLGLILKIIDVEETDRYIKEVVEPSKWDIGDEAPDVYKAIEYFGISEETFREANDAAIELNKEHGTAAVTYTEEEVSALYCGDKDEMNRRLMSPFAFYTGRRVLRANEILMMGVEEITEAGVNLDELSEYCARMRVKIPQHPQSDVEWYMKKIDKMEETIEEARALES